MPSKRPQRTQRDLGGALSLDIKGPPAQLLPPAPAAAPGFNHHHLAPYHDQVPSFPTGFSSSAASSIIGTPQTRPESPDLALLGATLPSVGSPFPVPEESPVMPEKRTLGDKTFNATAEMPQWMQDVTSGFAKEISQLMNEMEELRRQKQSLQL